MEIVPFIPSVVVANEAHTVTEESSYWEDAADLLPVFSSAFPSLGPFAFDKEIMALRIKARKASKEFLEVQLEANRVCKKFADLKKNPKDGGSPYRLLFRIMTCLLISKQLFSLLLSLFLICPNKEEKLSPLKFDKVVRGIFPSDEMFVDYNTIRSDRIILIICGDFNVVKGPGEKIGGVIPTTYFTKDFVDCCNALNLSDAPCVGNFFTWTNGKVKAKLDRHLKGLKALLKRLNKEEYGHISKKALRANDEFSQFVQLFDVNSATVEDRQKLQLLRKRACTKYFHDLVKKSYRDRSIACILDEFGQPTTSLAQIGELFVAFYKDLLGKSRSRISCRAEFINDGPIVSVSQQNQLTSAVTNQEIKDVLFDVDDQKAPGSDGYSAAFFKKNWDVIGEDFMDAVKEFFHSGKLLKQINYTVIALIPKTQQANVVGDFRPISCCNVIYKVISKVLATRLNTVLPSIIDHAQAAFIGGRSMSDNIFLAQELIRGYARKRISPRCMLIVDLRKAYDTIS
nr:uncharacterized protein LOC111375444 [Ipomoea batatas]